jgi:nucleotide-binding universal stress UspA family protein
MHASKTDPVLSFSNILLATDFSSASQAAFQTSLCVCGILKAKLTILHVFEYAEIVPRETGGRLLELDKLYAEAQIHLDDLACVARIGGIPCETVLSGGLAPETILQTIRSNQIDLAVLGTNALHGFERLVFGSTAESVLRAALCPVLTVGPLAVNAVRTDQTDGAIIFPTDFHESTMHAIRYAASFCEATSLSLHCLHVLPRTVEGGYQSHIVPQIMTEALQQVAAKNGITIDPPFCAITYGSEISNAVVHYAKQHKAKLIVLGIRQASMMASHVPAHIAHRIITEAPCPVLTMAIASQAHSNLAAACL